MVLGLWDYIFISNSVVYPKLQHVQTYISLRRNSKKISNYRKINKVIGNLLKMILMTAGSCFKKIHEFLKPFKYKFWFESVCAQMTEVSGPGQKRVCDLWGLTTGSYTGLTRLASQGQLPIPHQTWCIAKVSPSLKGAADKDPGLLGQLCSYTVCIISPNTSVRCLQEPVAEAFLRPLLVEGNMKTPFPLWLSIFSTLPPP